MKTYQQRIRELEAQGLTTSDAQAVVDAEDLKRDIQTRQKRINTLAALLANYLNDDREREDYEQHCEDNDKPYFPNSAIGDTEHIYGVALTLLYELEELEDIS